MAPPLKSHSTAGCDIQGRAGVGDYHPHPLNQRHPPPLAPWGWNHWGCAEVNAGDYRPHPPTQTPLSHLVSQLPIARWNLDDPGWTWLWVPCEPYVDPPVNRRRRSLQFVPGVELDSSPGIVMCSRSWLTKKSSIHKACYASVYTMQPRRNLGYMLWVICRDVFDMNQDSSSIQHSCRHCSSFADLNLALNWVGRM